MSQIQKILIVEDEPIIADDIAICIQEMGHLVLDILNSAEKALAFLEDQKVDLVLLDIKIKGEKDGIQLAQLIKEKYGYPFLFISSLYDKTTITRARNAEPLGYVVKPFKDEDITVAVEMALSKTQMSPVESTKSRELNLFIRENNSIVPLDFNTVLYIEASANYSIFYTRDQKHVVTQTLKCIEEVLQSQGYCRIHKKFLVNLRKIDRIELSVVFIDGKVLPIGKVYKKPLMDHLTIL